MLGIKITLFKENCIWFLFNDEQNLFIFIVEKVTCTCCHIGKSDKDLSVIKNGCHVDIFYFHIRNHFESFYDIY